MATKTRTALANVLTLALVTGIMYHVLTTLALR